MILENGIVRTLEPSMPTARALAIAGDVVAGGVGTHEQALASPDVVDLGGRCVLPGFNDAHVHFPTWALAQRQVRLEGTQSLDEALQRVAAAVRDVEPGRWLRGLGWRSGDWSPPVEPTKDALDRVTGDTPTALMARDYHSLWLNSAGLARANGELEAEGGVVVRDDRGEPTGVLREECAWHFRDAYVRPTDDEMLEASREGIKLANARGVTAVHDKDGWLGALAVFQRLQSEGSLSLRVWESHPKDDLGALLALPLAGPFGNDFLRLGYVKAFMDGTLGSQTARMLDGAGVEITSRAELEETIVRAAGRGFSVAVHAIGDRANRDALDAFAATREAWKGLRPRVEHAQLLAREDIGRFAELGVACSVQFSHAPSDRDLADRFWAGKTDGAYAYRSLWDSGAVVANGSDAPIEELDPWAGICAGVLRTIDDRPAWHPEQRLTLDEALIATCVTPPWLAGDERRRGKLTPGFLADLVVLDRDPFAVEPEELPSIQVVATMVGGRWVHNPPPWA
ncbi:MAG: amidohydrolase [Actinobacteria bacterium]|nr:MAG: amidohydrolase [Actinomycetota bacterium]